MSRGEKSRSVEEAVKGYASGDVTLRQAAALIEVTPREMIEILLAHGVKGNVAREQARRTDEHLNRILRREEFTDLDEI